MNIEMFIIIIALFILYVLLDTYFEQYKEIKIIFLGIIIISIFYILSRNINDVFLSKIFNICSLVSLIIIILLIIYIFVNKIVNKNENEG